MIVYFGVVVHRFSSPYILTSSTAGFPITASIAVLRASFGSERVFHLLAVAMTGPRDDCVIGRFLKSKPTSNSMSSTTTPSPAKRGILPAVAYPLLLKTTERKGAWYALAVQKAAERDSRR